MASIGGAAGCAAHRSPTANAGSTAAGPQVSGVWDAVTSATIDEGVAAGDVKIEKQEWHLSQSGSAIRGYYIAALTYVSGDGRPYVCSRQPQFSAFQRFEVAGHVQAGAIEIQEMGQADNPSESRCDPGMRQLARYRGLLDGDVLTLVSGRQQTRLYRIHATTTTLMPSGRTVADATTPATSRDRSADSAAAPASRAMSMAPLPVTPGALNADVSGTWIWEHQGSVPGGDQKQEREEWHVEQNGTKISGYYDRIVHQVSTDGHAYRCSMALEFQIATRYQFSGDVSGDEVRIIESSYEVLSPSACDNGKRRLDVYQGKVSTDEIRLVWGMGGQVLRRPRPDVPTQRF
ncbi:MAG TPA: hypothetical protein VN903_24695 [Polyangia bacterium]|nr:hypothetical protein [Polyangia bacterium]